MADNPIISAMERRVGVNTPELAIDFSKLLFLVVDANPDMRTATSMTLASFGANRIEFAGRVAEALGRVQRARYDVILCDYSLGHDYDGVHLFEEVKQRNLVKQSCVFFVVTSERRSQMVMGAVEQAPDDYLLKPFTGQLLAQRLERAIRKKKEFECVDNAILQHQYLKAIEECNQRIKNADPYVLDFLKLKGRLSIMTGDYAAAKETYRSVLNARDIPWARLGLAKACFHLKELDEAETLFNEVLSYNDRVMEAYDWLAKIHTLRQENARAQEMLEKAISISPWIVNRQKQLGEVAHRNQALGVAEAAYKKTIAIAKNSFWRDAGDYAKLARVQLDNKDHKAAHATVSEVRKEFSHQPEAQMLSFALESMVLLQTGERDRAKAALAEAERLHASLPDVPDSFSLDLAQACFVHGNGDKATELIRNVVKNNHENPDIIGRVGDLYQAVGKAEEGEALVRKTSDDIINLNNRAVRLARDGNFEGAVDLFLRATEEMPNNLQILLNTINALLGYVNTQGWHESYMQLVDSLIERARLLDRSNVKFQKLEQLMKNTKTRFKMS